MWARTLCGRRRNWWAGRESNPHSQRRLIYSQRSSPPAQPTHGWERAGKLRACGGPNASCSVGADDGTRTRNRRFTKPLLYQLSYVGAQRLTAERPLAPGDDRAERQVGQAWRRHARARPRCLNRSPVRPAGDRPGRAAGPSIRPSSIFAAGVAGTARQPRGQPAPRVRRVRRPPPCQVQSPPP
jgi:hypothetical protein